MKKQIYNATLQKVEQVGHHKNESIGVDSLQAKSIVDLRAASSQLKRFQNIANKNRNKNLSLQIKHAEQDYALPVQ